MSICRRRALRPIVVLTALLLPLGALADTSSVVVKNAATNPVPVAGNVNATIQGTPNVNATINGTPTVNIGSMPSIPDPEKSPFFIQYGNAGGASLLTQFGFIPPGQIFVIESESAYCFVTAGTQPLYAFVGTSEGRLYMPFQKTGTDGNFDYYLASLPNRIYATGSGSGTGDVFFDFIGQPPAGSTPVTNCDINLIGHLVAYP
jgi:hypothetical protein